MCIRDRVRLGRADRKGAPDTFDVTGYVALLGRLRWQAHDVVYAPAFDRHLEEPIAGAIPVDPGVPLVVVEGNYLLHPDGRWALGPDQRNAELIVANRWRADLVIRLP